MPHSVPQLYQNPSLPGNMPHRAKTWPKSAGWQSPWTHAATWPESVRCRSPWKHTTACQNWARIGPKLPASGRFWSISGTLWYVLRDALSMGVLLPIRIWFCRMLCYYRTLYIRFQSIYSIKIYPNTNNMQGGGPHTIIYIHPIYPHDPRRQMSLPVCSHFAAYHIRCVGGSCALLEVRKLREKYNSSVKWGDTVNDHHTIPKAHTRSYIARRGKRFKR